MEGMGLDWRGGEWWVRLIPQTNLAIEKYIIQHKTK